MLKIGLVITGTEWGKTVRIIEAQHLTPATIEPVFSLSKGD